MALTEDQLLGLYICIPVYFVFLGVAAFWAYKRMETLVHDKVSDQLSAHYLGGQTFGPWLTAGTVFASIFSGYTVVGIPNEAYNQGWTSLRWMPYLFSIFFGYFGTALRLRKASNIRNHQTPVDFITDRYQCQLLRYTIVFLQILPAIIFLSAQVAALKNAFNAMFNLDPDAVYPVVIMMIIILLFEWIGGLSSVALTDTIQAVIMMFSFIAIPAVLSRSYYSWSELDSNTYPRPDFYDTPSADFQLGMWQTSMILISYFTLPQYVQRIYATESINNLKISFSILTLSVWFTMLPAVYIGTIGVQILDNEDTSSPFTSIVATLLDLGGFARALGYIALTASLAAIMSTTDSLVISISQLLTVEVLYPIWPNASPRKISWAGRLASLVASGIALCIGLVWKNGITGLVSIQFPLSTQAMPAFLLGLYTKNRDFHPWCIASGAIFSTIYVIIIMFTYIGREDNPVPIDAGLTGLAINVVLIALLEVSRRFLSISISLEEQKKKADNEEEEQETSSTPPLLFPHRPKWDTPALNRFGKTPLTSHLIWKSMEGINEPFANPWWVFLALVSVSICVPILPSNLPTIENQVGIPWWAQKMIYLNILPFVILVIAVKNMPTRFPIDEEKIQAEGIDPDLVELTLHEKGMRQSYDGTNVLVEQRRSNITEILSSLESDKVVDNEDSLERAKSRRKLSALLHPLDESESDKGIIDSDNKDDVVGIHETVANEGNIDE